MSGVREPVAAGTFYPGERDVLADTVDALVAAAFQPLHRSSPIALIVPHAGYAYSGPIAATGYALLRGSGISRVALFGPSHFVPLQGLAVPGTDAWRTPLGDVRVDEELREDAVHHGARIDDRPHAPEHSLEVQLPFLQRLLGEGATMLPVAVGLTVPDEVASLMAAMLPLALVVVSTDLSHYETEATARRLDRRTADAVLAKSTDQISSEDACGSQALRGIVELAHRLDLAIGLLDLRNSADTAGDPGRVVGYGAFAIERGL